MAVTETIQELLQGIDDAQYGRDMRDYIHKGIQKCYEEGSAGETDLVARQAISDLEAEKADIPLWVDMGTISALPVTKNATGVTADMICTAFVAGTPGAIMSDWTVTTASGSITISGTVSGSTTLKILLEEITNVTAS